MNEKLFSLFLDELVLNLEQLNTIQVLELLTTINEFKKKVLI